MNNIDKFKEKLEREMKSGFFSLLVLHIIKENGEPIYGYSIIKKLNEATNGSIKFREGTIYPILRYLQNQKFVKSFLEESPQGAARKYYHITKSGRLALIKGTQSWQQLRNTLDSVISLMEGENGKKPGN